MVKRAVIVFGGVDVLGQKWAEGAQAYARGARRRRTGADERGHQLDFRIGARFGGGRGVAWQRVGRGGAGAGGGGGAAGAGGKRKETHMNERKRLIMISALDLVVESAPYVLPEETFFTRATLRAPRPTWTELRDAVEVLEQKHKALERDVAPVTETL
jgi:hypothetical protein